MLKDKYWIFRASVTVGVIAFILFAVTLFILNPPLADRVAREDGVIENISTLLLFLSVPVFFFMGIKYARMQRWLECAYMFAFAALCFVIGMEEISWMQRIFHVASPEFFMEHNLQKELNFHNLNSKLTARLYYLGGFVFLCVVPFFKTRIETFLRKTKFSAIASLLPSVWFFAPFAPTSALITYRFLTSAVYSVMCIAAILMLAAGCITRVRRKAWRAGAYYASVLLLTAGTGLFFSYHYMPGIRFWAATEYRELLIPTGIFVYGIDVLWRNWRDMSQRKIK